MASERDPLLAPSVPPLGTTRRHGTGSTSALGPASPIGHKEGAPDAALDLVRRLCEALADEGVRYCHWKSNEALDRSAKGENDLDLLVSRVDVQPFGQILRRLGFKEGGPPAEKSFPGVLHAYGLDHPSGRLVHVHAQYHLVIGDDMTKNYRLPIEETYLDSAEQGPLFRVPAPEFEFVVFVIRMMLKHSTRDGMLLGQGSLSVSERRELDDLRSRADLDRARLVVREHLPFISDELWDRCLRSLARGSSRGFRARAARRLERALSSCSRRNHSMEVGLRVWRRGRLAFRRRVLRRRPARHRLDSGGALIAIVGADGAGKSTAVDEVYRWLSKDFETARIHLGKPPRSWLSSAVAGLLRPKASGRGPTRTTVTHSSGGHLTFNALRDLTRRFLTSRNRYAAYAWARRFAMRGGIVVSDRYPLPQITLMDSAATARMFLASDPTGRLVGLLGRLERRYYDRILYPDILIALRVHPDTAAHRRRGEDDEDGVRRRSEEAWQLDWRRTPAVVIDADRRKDEVLAEIRSIIWSGL
jgi:thymidylate kinase